MTTTSLPEAYLGMAAMDVPEIRKILESKSLTASFQPIFSSLNGCVFGYEALARPKAPDILHSVVELFEVAARTGLTDELEAVCRRNTFECAAANGGDDFLLILTPENSVHLCEQIIESFSSRLMDMHGQKDYDKR